MMDRTILKSVITDNQLEIPKYKVNPRKSKLYLEA